MLKRYKPREQNKVMKITEGIPILEQKIFLENLLNPHRIKKLCYLDPKGYLEGEPKEFSDRLFYLCLRGLRDGISDLLEIKRFSETSQIAYSEEYEEKRYDPMKKKMKKTGRKIDPIEERIKQRLLKDPVAKKYLDWTNSDELFESDCHDIASGVSTHYGHSIRQKELKLKGVI